VSDRQVLILTGVVALVALVAGGVLANRAAGVAAERDARVAAVAEAAFGDAERREELRSTLDSLARAAAGERGRTGLAVRDVRYGTQMVAGSPDTAAAFPMMSVYKVPIAVAVLADAAEGKLSLQDTVEFRPNDVRAFRSPLSERSPEGGERLTVDQLLELAVTESDNAASDLLLELVGGADAVNSRMRLLELEGIRVDRSERELALDMLGVDGADREREFSRAQWDSLASATPDERAAAAMDVYVDDERDTTTPAAMATLFARLASGSLLPPPYTQRLLELLENPAGQPRLRAGLASGTRAWSKGGTSMRAGERIGAYNDVAIIERPDGRRTVIAMFVSGTEVEPDSLRELARSIGEAVSTSGEGG